MIAALVVLAAGASALEATPLRIGTRGSPLALAQVRFAASIIADRARTAESLQNVNAACAVAPAAPAPASATGVALATSGSFASRRREVGPRASGRATGRSRPGRARRDDRARHTTTRPLA
jgi:hypothetical protein